MSLAFLRSWQAWRRRPCISILLLVWLGTSSRPTNGFVSFHGDHTRAMSRRPSFGVGENIKTPWAGVLGRWGKRDPFQVAVLVRAGAHKRDPMAMVTTGLSSLILRPEVVLTSSKAVAELLSCCALGVLAARRGILSPVNVGALSKIVYGVFLPSLLLVNVAKTCVSQPIASLLPIPAFAIVQICLGLIVSEGTMRLVGARKDTEAGREAKVSSAFQNSGILPLIFLNSMFRGHPDPTLLSRGVAYVSFYLMGWSPLFWTVGNNILTGHLDQGTSKESNAVPTASAAGAPLQVMPRKKGFASSMRDVPAILKGVVSSKLGQRLLTPPIIACFAGLVIGLSPPLRWLLMEAGAPLSPLWGALSNLSAAYTPSGVLVLAGSLANCPSSEGWLTKDTRKTLTSVAVVRWLLLPFFTAGLVLSGLRLGLIPQDPMLLFVLMMQSAMPSAQNSVIMLQVAGLQDAAGRCARTLCTIYLMSVFPVSILLTIFLSAVQLL